MLGAVVETSPTERAVARPDKAALRALFLRTLDEISLDKVIPQRVACVGGVLQVGGEEIDLRAYRRILVVSIGKAAYQMADALVAIVQPIELTGVISGSSPGSGVRPGFRRFQGGHPYPNEDSYRAGWAASDLLRTAGKNDLVIYLLSGGGSAICEKPLFDDIGLADCNELYRLLVTCGANILDVNYVRKHFSALKGGRLAKVAHPARQVTLYVSDAPPGAPSNVASGPTMPDESSSERCYEIIDRFGLLSRLPASIRRRVERREIPETPKLGDPLFANSSWHCLLWPEAAVVTAARLCAELGWESETDMMIDDDCPRDCAVSWLLARLEKLRKKHRGVPVAIVAGGEYCCPAPGGGCGGRNQAFVLECLARIAGSDVAVLSAGTDGIDGTSPAAGAVADGSSLERARRLGLDPEESAARSDSYSLFSRLGDAIITGPTGNNVRDMRILAAA